MNALDGFGGRLRRRLAMITAAVFAALGLACGVLAAEASAATLAATKPCFVNGTKLAQVTILGAGFNAGDDVEIEGHGFLADVVAGASGSFLATGDAPILMSGPASKSLRLTAIDVTTPAITATTTIRVANLAVLPTPLSVRNVHKDKVTFSFSGFTPGKRIYGYWLRKKFIAKATFGKAKGPCGVLKQKALLYPGGHPTSDKYTVVFEQTTRYSKRATPLFSGVLSIDTL
jgi:hypothetical protein